MLRCWPLPRHRVAVGCPLESCSSRRSAVWARNPSAYSSTAWERACLCPIWRTSSLAQSRPPRGLVADLGRLFAGCLMDFLNHGPAFTQAPSCEAACTSNRSISSKLQSSRFTMPTGLSEKVRSACTGRHDVPSYFSLAARVAIILDALSNHASWSQYVNTRYYSYAFTRCRLASSLSNFVPP